MLYLLKGLYGFLFPPGLFVLLLAGLTIWLFRSRAGFLKTGLCALVTLLLYVSTMPLAGEALIRSLEQQYPVPAKYNADGLILLTGGAVSGTTDVDGAGNLNDQTLARTAAAAVLYKQSKLPILVSGGQVYADTGNESQIAKRKLISLGVPEASIVIEDQSRSTKENAEKSKAMLQQLGWKRPLLVTSAYHLPRAVKHFTDVGVSVIPYPTSFSVSPTPVFGVNKLIPSAGSVENLNQALKEYVGLLQ
jgi:uncharacterized SAM-binding protein YcdF (DUF218 family)